MLERAPHSPVHGPGWLIDWRLTFGGEDLGWDGALATVVEDPGHSVFVMLYDVPPQDEELLLLIQDILFPSHNVFLELILNTIHQKE